MQFFSLEVHLDSDLLASVKVSRTDPNSNTLFPEPCTASTLVTKGQGQVSPEARRKLQLRTQSGHTRGPENPREMVGRQLESKGNLVTEEEHNSILFLLVER